MPSSDLTDVLVRADPQYPAVMARNLYEQMAEAVRSAGYRYVSAEETEVLRTAVAEYRAGHRSDRAVAKDPAVTYTDSDRRAYQQALYEHYQAVRALLLSTTPPPTPTKEPTDVRP